MLKFWAVSALVFLVGACAQTAPSQPYYGINVDSYGPLRIYEDSVTKLPVTPPSCDSNAKYADTDELSRRITAYMIYPVSGAEEVDPSLKLEDLQSSFRIPGDLDGYNVTLLDRNHDHIIFWYRSQTVTLSEVSNAAHLYCSRFQKPSIYVGSSQKCSQPEKMPVVINGQTQMIETYVISAFECAVPQQEETASLSAPQRVRDIQVQLKRLGYMSSPPDGVFGPNTESAIEAFQRKNGLEATGKPDDALLRVLETS